MKQILIILLLVGSATLRAQNMQVIDSLNLLLKTEKVDTSRVNLYNQLAWEYRNSNIQFTDSFANIAIEEGRKINFYKGTGNAYINKAFVHRNSANYNKAIETFRWALVQFLKTNYRQGYSSAYNGIASVHYLMGNFSLAQFYFFESHKISEELGDKKGVGRTLLNIGSVLIEQKKYQRALRYFEKAIPIFQSLNDASGMAVCWNNIGNVYQLEGDRDTAILYYRKSTEASKLVGDLKSVAVGMRNIAILYNDRGYYREALNYYLQSLAIDEHLGNVPSIVVTQTNIAQSYYDLSMYHAAANYALNSLKLATKQGMKTDIMYAYALLYKVEEKRNNYKQAFEYHKLYKQYSDSIYNEEASTKVNELEEQYIKERIEKQRILANKEDEIMLVRSQEKENAVTQYIFIIGLVLIVFVSFIYIVFFLLRKTK
jgi:tetratricopeptide (TPR) repeat protein